MDLLKWIGVGSPPTISVSPSLPVGAGDTSKAVVNSAVVELTGPDAKQFGMKNFGNTCYANSVLQALYFCQPFRDLICLVPDRFHDELLNPPSLPPTSPVAPSLAQHNTTSAGTPPTDSDVTVPPMPPTLFSALRSLYMHISTNPSTKGTVSPTSFINKLKKDNELFRSTMHQDAHEFLNYLLNKIVEDLEADMKETKDREREREEKDRTRQDDLSKSISSLTPSTDNARTETSAGSGSRSQPTFAGFSRQPTLVQKLFEGVLTNETRCLTCETVSARDEPFLDLSIDIEENSSVTSCLRQFSASEMLCQKNKFFCDSCCSLQEAEKRMKIKTLPNVLALHLKRFKPLPAEDKYVKLAYRVAFPIELRLFNTVDDAVDMERLYRLFAIVVHIGGGPHHGHYITIVRSSGGIWRVFDDETVYTISESEIPKYFGDAPAGAGYVLFYQAADLDPHAVGLDKKAGPVSAPASVHVATPQEPIVLHANGVKQDAATVSSSPILSPQIPLPSSHPPTTVPIPSPPQFSRTNPFLPLTQTQPAIVDISSPLSESPSASTTSLSSSHPPIVTLMSQPNAQAPVTLSTSPLPRALPVPPSVAGIYPVAPQILQSPPPTPSHGPRPASPPLDPESVSIPATTRRNFGLGIQRPQSSHETSPRSSFPHSRPKERLYTIGMSEPTQMSTPIAAENGKDKGSRREKVNGGGNSGGGLGWFSRSKRKDSLPSYAATSTTAVNSLNHVHGNGSGTHVNNTIIPVPQRSPRRPQTADKDKRNLDRISAAFSISLADPSESASGSDSVSGVPPARRTKNKTAGLRLHRPRTAPGISPEARSPISPFDAPSAENALEDRHNVLDPRSTVGPASGNLQGDDIPPVPPLPITDNHVPPSTPKRKSSMSSRFMGPLLTNSNPPAPSVSSIPIPPPTSFARPRTAGASPTLFSNPSPSFSSSSTSPPPSPVVSSTMPSPRVPRRVNSILPITGSVLGGSRPSSGIDPYSSRPTSSVYIGSNGYDSNNIHRDHGHARVASLSGSTPFSSTPPNHQSNMTSFSNVPTSSPRAQDQERDQEVVAKDAPTLKRASRKMSLTGGLFAGWSHREKDKDKDKDRDHHLSPSNGKDHTTRPAGPGISGSVHDGVTRRPSTVVGSPSTPSKKSSMAVPPNTTTMRFNF